MEEKLREIVLESWRNQIPNHVFCERIQTEYHHKDFESTLSDVFLDIFLGQPKPSVFLVGYLKNLLSIDIIPHHVFFTRVYENFVKYPDVLPNSKFVFVFFELTKMFLEHGKFEDPDFYLEREKVMSLKYLPFHVNYRSIESFEKVSNENIITPKIVPNEVILERLMLSVQTVLSLVIRFMKQVIKENNKKTIDDEDDNDIVMEDSLFEEDLMSSKELLKESYKTLIEVFSLKRMKVFIDVLEGGENKLCSKLFRIIKLIDIELNKNKWLWKVLEPERADWSQGKFNMFFRRLRDCFNVKQRNLSTEIVGNLIYFVEDEIFSYNIFHSNILNLSRRLYFLSLKKNISLGKIFVGFVIAGCKRINYYITVTKEGKSKKSSNVSIQNEELLVFVWKSYIFVKLILVFKEVLKRIEKVDEFKDTFKSLFKETTKEIKEEFLELLSDDEKVYDLINEKEKPIKEENEEEGFISYEEELEKNRKYSSERDNPFLIHSGKGGFIDVRNMLISSFVTQGIIELDLAKKKFGSGVKYLKNFGKEKIGENFDYLLKDFNTHFAIASDDLPFDPMSPAEELSENENQKLLSDVNFRIPEKDEIINLLLSEKTFLSEKGNKWCILGNDNLKNFCRFIFQNPERIEIFHVYGKIPKLLMVLIENLFNPSIFMNSTPIDFNSTEQKDSLFSYYFMLFYLIFERFFFRKKVHQLKFIKNLVKTCYRKTLADLNDMKNGNIPVKVETLKENLNLLNTWFYYFLRDSTTNFQSQEKENKFYTQVSNQLFSALSKKEEKQKRKRKKASANDLLIKNFTPVITLTSSSQITQLLIFQLIQKKITMEEFQRISINYCNMGYYASISFFFSFNNSLKDLGFNYGEVMMSLRKKIFENLYIQHKKNIKNSIIYFPICGLCLDGFKFMYRQVCNNSPNEEIKNLKFYHDFLTVVTYNCVINYRFKNFFTSTTELLGFKSKEKTVSELLNSFLSGLSFNFSEFLEKKLFSGCTDIDKINPYDLLSIQFLKHKLHPSKTCNQDKFVFYLFNKVIECLHKDKVGYVDSIGRKKTLIIFRFFLKYWQII